MNEECVIRKIEDVDDFDEIMHIETRAFDEPYTKDLFLYDFLKHPYSVYFKLLLADKVIGYFGLWVVFEEAQITTIAVDPDYQGRGYGKMLMDFIIDYIKDCGCRNITLEVRVSNEKAITYYEKYHFKIVAVRKRYYENGEDAYLMKLDME